MAKKRKVCKATKKFLDDPHHKDHEPTQGTTTNWKGRVFIAHPEQSLIAQKMGIKEPGEYAIKV
jgi:RNA polymerase subunit RPABC4/transcription elongation factor Spt4